MIFWKNIHPCISIKCLAISIDQQTSHLVMIQEVELSECWVVGQLGWQRAQLSLQGHRFNFQQTLTGSKEVPLCGELLRVGSLCDKQLSSEC